MFYCCNPFSSVLFVSAGGSHRLGGQHVASTSERATERFNQLHHRHAVPQSTEVSSHFPSVGFIRCRPNQCHPTVCIIPPSQILLDECPGLLHRLSHRLRRHLGVVPHSPRKQGGTKKEVLLFLIHIVGQSTLQGTRSITQQNELQPNTES